MTDPLVAIPVSAVHSYTKKDVTYARDFMAGNLPELQAYPVNTGLTIVLSVLGYILAGAAGTLPVLSLILYFVEIFTLKQFVRCILLSVLFGLLSVPIMHYAAPLVMAMNIQNPNKEQSYRWRIGVIYIEELEDYRKANLWHYRGFPALIVDEFYDIDYNIFQYKNKSSNVALKLCTIPTLLLIVSLFV